MIKNVTDLSISCVYSHFIKIYRFWKNYDLTSDKNLLNFDSSTQKSQKLYFDPFRAKYITFDLKGQKSYISWHWRVMQNLKKTDSWFGKCHEEIGKLLPEHSKVSKLGLWWDIFIESRKCMSLKFTEELCVMAMKHDAKFEEELTCHFKIDRRNLTNFDPNTTWKSQKFAV